MEGAITNHPTPDQESLPIENSTKGTNEDEDPFDSQHKVVVMPPKEEIANPVREDVGERTKRSSVVDIWKKREASIVEAGVSNGNRKSFLGSPLPPSGGKSRHVSSRPSYNYEEKKEPEPGEDEPWDTSQSTETGMKPELSDVGNDPQEIGASKRRSKNLPPLPTASPARNFSVDQNNTARKDGGVVASGGGKPVTKADSSSSSPSITANARNIWKKRDSSLKAKDSDKGNSENDSESKIANTSSFGSGTSGDQSAGELSTPSISGSVQSRGNMKDRWNKRTQSQDNHSSPVPSYLSDLSNQRQSPVSHHGSGKESLHHQSKQPEKKALTVHPPSPSQSETSSQGFADMRARWQKFGSEKVNKRESVQRGQSNLLSPGVPIPKSPALRNKDSSKVPSTPHGNKFPAKDENVPASPVSQSILRDGSPSSGNATPSSLSAKSKQVADLRRQAFRRNRKPSFESEKGDKGATTPTSSVTNQCSTPTRGHYQNPSTIDSPSSIDGGNGPSGTRKKSHFKVMGQKHAARPKTPQNVGIASKSPAAHTSDNSKSFMFSEDSTRNEQNINDIAGGSSGALSQPILAEDDENEPGAIISKAVGPDKGPLSKRLDKKALMAKFRRRTNRKPTVPADDQTVGSDPLSDVFSDTVPEHLREKLTAQLTTYKSPSPRHDGTKIRSSVPMKTMMSSGANGDQVYTDRVNSVKAHHSSSQKPSEYASLCLSDSASFAMPESTQSGHSRLQVNTKSGINHDTASEANSMISNDGSHFTGSFSQMSVPSPRSAAASPLASRAGKHLREMRQRKTPEEKESLYLPQRLQTNHADPAYNRRPTQGATMQSDGRENDSGSGRFDENQRSAATKPSSSMAFNPDDYMNKPRETGPPRRNPSFSSDTTGTNTHTNSTTASTVVSDTSGPVKRKKRSKDMVAEAFVSQSNTDVAAFTNTFQSLSLGQLANDLREEAGSVLNVKALDLSKFATDLNNGMSAASESLNQLVGGDLFSNKTKEASARREPSPVEEVAIEVEYIEASDEEESMV